MVDISVMELNTFYMITGDRIRKLHDSTRMMINDGEIILRSLHDYNEYRFNNILVSLPLSLHVNVNVNVTVYC